MQKLFKLLRITLNLFDGEGGGAGEGAATTGESSTTPAATPGRRNKTSGEKVLYGKQDTDPAPSSDDAGQSAQNVTSETKVTSNTLEERKKAFKDLISGEYKDLYAQEVQGIIDRRFRETKNLETQVDQLRTVTGIIAERYGLDANDTEAILQAIDDDDAYWQSAADDADMSVDQYKAMKKLERENEALKAANQARENLMLQNQQMQRWAMEAEAIKQKYPSFDLELEAQNPDFVAMLRSGISMEHAFNVIHLDEINDATARASAAITEQQVVQNIRAKGNRPAENGTSSQSAFTVKDDIHKLTRADRAEIARRAQRGETIRF